MKLTKKISEKREQRSTVEYQSQTAKSSEINYRPDWSATIPHGKHVGKTVEWVYENEPGYYNWMLANDILPAWGLIESAEPRPVAPIVNDEGVRYLYLTFTRVKNGTPSKWLD